MNKKVLGILGGLGPEATSEFYKRIIKKTKVTCDQDHMRIIIYSNPKIPDRSDYLLGNGISPFNSLMSTLDSLVKFNVDFVVIPCNTAHFFYDKLQKNIKIPILNMIDLTAKEIKIHNYKKIYLLATEGTIQSELYHKTCKVYDIVLNIPPKNIQVLIANLIKKIKIDDQNEIIEIKKKLEPFFLLNTDYIYILGCTELSIIFNDIKIKTIDPMDILVKKCISFAGYKERG